MEAIKHAVGLAEVKKYTIETPYLDIGCSLGEGPYFDATSNTFRFVDIVKKKLHTVDVSAGPSSHKVWNLDYSIGVTANIEGNDEEFIFGGKRGFGLFNKKTGEHRLIKEMWDASDRKPDQGGKTGKGHNKEERMRSNDGSVDAKGRFYVGTMNDPELVKEPIDEGILFRLDPDLGMHTIAQNLIIPNGTSWTSDNKTMYFTDTPSGKVMAYPYDLETGTIEFADGKALFTSPYSGGVPDGHAQDAEGYLWVACYGVGKVVRVSPAGYVVAEIDLPTRCVTSAAFVGTELYITTAEEEDPEKHPESKKYQGGIFKVDVGVRGAPLNNFRLETKV